MKKVKVELIVLGDNFRVKRVTNSTEWLPDQLISKDAVNKMMARTNTEVVLTKK